MYKSEKQLDRNLNMSFEECPDLSIAWAAAVAGAGREGRMYGLQTLRGKESDRWLGLLNNLSSWSELRGDEKEWSIDIRQRTEVLTSGLWDTLDDHRFAMAGAVLAEVHQPMRLSEISSVKKSFPAFTSEMERLGYRFRNVE
jgi:3-phosphoshikimate 1-carboxyvinyltransferase